MYRNVHGSDELELDKKLCSKAQDWAEKLAKRDGLEHASKEIVQKCYRQNKNKIASDFFINN